MIFITILVFYADIALSQINSGYNYRKLGKKFDSSMVMIIGEIVEIDDKNIVILTRDDKKEELTITPTTSLIQEINISKSDLRKGANLLVIGRHSNKNIIHAAIIKMLDKREGIINKPPFHHQKWAGHRYKKQGPIVGVITELDPLTIKSDLAGLKVIKIIKTTKLMKEIPIKGQEVKVGMRVKMVSPRKIKKIEMRPSFKEEQGLERVLLPNLLQQPRDSNFIYNIWLGRGLYSNNELDRAFNVANNLGIRYFMVEFKWGYVEPENNKWEWNNEKKLDVEHVIILAKQYDMSIIPYFNVMMPWGERKYPDPKKGECEGRPSSRGQFQAPNSYEYAEYVFEVVKKLKENGVNVKYVKLDNEISALNDGYTSRSCFIDINAKQLKEAENAGYDKIKSVYPEVMISSTSFQFPGISCTQRGPNCETFKERLNKFVKVYFEDEPKPKFDFLGINEVFGGTGLWSKKDKPVNATYQYNFGSYFDAYDMWRDILNKYGYANTPIFNIESIASSKGNQDIQLIQSAVFARINANKNNVIGWILSQLTGSKRFSEGANVGITKLTDGYELREGYLGYYTLINTLSKYKEYEGRMMGKLNSFRPWMEKFSDLNGNNLYVAFIPFRFKNDKKQTIELRIGPGKEARVTRSDAIMSIVESNANGLIFLEIDQHPLMIEVKR